MTKKSNYTTSSPLINKKIKDKGNETHSGQAKNTRESEWQRANRDTYSIIPLYLVFCFPLYLLICWFRQSSLIFLFLFSQLGTVSQLTWETLSHAVYMLIYIRLSILTSHILSDLCMWFRSLSCHLPHQIHQWKARQDRCIMVWNLTLMDIENDWECDTWYKTKTRAELTVVDLLH